MYQLHGYTCKECLEIYYAKKENRSHRCSKCGRKRLNEVNRQLREKKGPYYELWKKEFDAWRYGASSTEETLRPER